MNAQTANRGKGTTAFAVRLLLWLFAAFSLADFPSAAAEATRLGKFASVKSEAVGNALDVQLSPAAYVTDDDPLPQPGIVEVDLALDTDDWSSSSRLFPRGRTAAMASIVAAQCPDGQSLSAFNSRAPPRLG
jgi:hypothetical protein